jgi:hypothetical protein
VHRTAVEEHGPAAWLEQAREPAQQGGLAAGVRADDDGDPTVGDLDVELMHDVVGVVAERESFGSQLMSHPPRPSRLTVMRIQMR